MKILKFKKYNGVIFHITNLLAILQQPHQMKPRTIGTRT